ncbi:MAG: prepilin-type N-terminal cleavage/methylation domain-containing protein [Clostridia bacterium]
MLYKERKFRGFTLVEMLVILLILAVLAAFAIPSYLGYLDNTNTTLDKLSLSRLNSFTKYYKMNKNITTTDIFEGTTTDTARMQILVASKYLDEIIIPKKKSASFSWDIANQKWLYNLDAKVYVILLTASDLPKTIEEIYFSFDDYLKEWMKNEGKLPIVASANASSTWTAANYTGTDKTNIFQAKFWNDYYKYVNVDGFNSSNASISDFKIFFKRDTQGVVTAESAGVYLQIGGNSMIRFSDGTVIKNKHYSTYIDSITKELKPPQ